MIYRNQAPCSRADRARDLATGQVTSDSRNDVPDFKDQTIVGKLRALTSTQSTKMKSKTCQAVLMRNAAFACGCIVGVNLVLLAWGAFPLSAQPVDQCSYEVCALRIESNRIVRGASGETVTGFGWFGTGPKNIVWKSDSALHYAGQYQRHNLRSNVLQYSGAALILAGTFALDQNDGPDSRNRALVLLSASTVSTVIGAIEQRQARNRLSRAIWWHNRELRAKDH